MDSINYELILLISMREVLTATVTVNVNCHALQQQKSSNIVLSFWIILIVGIVLHILNNDTK
jgi:hypothetical protein